MVTNPFGEFLKAFRDAHKAADTDAERYALHHTIGSGPYQAAPGNHKHYDNTPLGGVITWFFDDIPDNFLECLGQTVDQADYPEFFEARGILTATYTLPDMSDLYPRGHASGGTAIGTAVGNTNHQVTLTTTELPAHAHTDPSHTHTGPSHSHSIDHTHATDTHNHGGSTVGNEGAHVHSGTWRENATAFGPQNNIAAAGSASGSIVTKQVVNNSGTAHSHTIGNDGHTHGAFSGTSGSDGTGSTGSGGGGNTGSTGTGSAFSIEPAGRVAAMIMRMQ